MALRSSMNDEEILAAQYLAHCGYTDVRHEPDGKVPPDFLVDNRVAIEVRRLNQNFDTGGSFEGLEQTWRTLAGRVKKLTRLLGPPTRGVSWFIHFRFQRPVEEWKTLKPKIQAAFRAFIESDVHKPGRILDVPSFTLEVYTAASKLHPTFFLLGSFSDLQAGGFVLSELSRNLRLCIDEKARKIAPYRSRYPVWWLVLVDHVGRSLSHEDRHYFLTEMRPSHDFDRIILIDPDDHRRSLAF